MRRLRARLDRLESQASATMGDARDVLELAKDTLDDLADGVHFTFTVGPFKVPLSITLDMREDK